MSLLGVDVGTTHSKVVVCHEDGTPASVVRQPTPLARDHHGLPFHPPEALWAAVVSAIHESALGSDLAEVQCVGVASMAEAGLFVDTRTGEPRSEIVPWYDQRSSEQARTIAAADEPRKLFQRAGLQPSFKYGLSKILWLRTRDSSVGDHAVWLSVADYVVFRLTGHMGTDPTLAARTYVFSLEDGAWDDAWVRHFGLLPDNFPPVLPTGEPIGQVSPEVATLTGLPAGIPVAVSGHDHICAALAVGMATPGLVVDSLGTAESMMGVLDSPELEARGFDSGLKIVPHVVPDTFCWLGGTRAAGGALDWAKSTVAESPLSHDEAIHLVETTKESPSNILFFPYLSGSGGVHSDDRVRGAFIGLDASHRRADLLKAVLEGTAFESESIRRAAECLTDHPIDQLVVVGGGAAVEAWVQIKADVSGCPCSLPELEEATGVGAGLLAGLGSGIFASVEDILSIAGSYRAAGTTICPDPTRHRRYRQLYETGYLPVGQALRAAAAVMYEEESPHD